MPAPLPPLQRPGIERAIIWLSLFGLMVIVVMFTLLIANDREDLATDATDRAEIQALLLAEHAARLFDAAELALSTVIDETGGTDLRRLRGPQRLHRRLAWLARRLPYVEAFWLHGPKGTLHLSSLAHPPPRSDASDSEFFVANRENADLGVHIGAVSGAQTDRPTFRISRRIEDESGGFRGVASLTVEVAFFRDFYGRLPLPTGSIVCLRRAPGLDLLVRQPPSTPAEGVPGRLRSAITANSAQGRFRSVSPADGVERIVAYRKVPEFPLYVTVSVPLTAFRDKWLGLVALRLAEAAAAMLILGLLTTLALREAGRQRLFQETLEQRVTARTAELELAIQEVHHRVRNNLQVVGSLLTMQAARVADPGVRAALSESIGRVHTISLVHQTLYGTGTVTELRFGDYLRALVSHLGDLYGAAGADIQVAGNNPTLPLETAVPLALIVHEALSNALKHAFPRGSAPRVAVTVSAEDGHLALTVADAGTGLAPGHRDGLGMKIMRSLATQIDATLEVTSDATGTRVMVRVV